MSVNSSIATSKGVDSNAVDTYDSGDDWEIGVGNLIIDLDADLEKDRQKLEMNNSSSSSSVSSIAAPGSSSSSKDCGASVTAASALSESLKFTSASVQPPPGNPHKETGKSKVKRSKTSKDANKSLSSAALYGIPEISSAGKRQEVQGRPGDVSGMNSALGQTVSSSNNSSNSSGGCNNNNNNINNNTALGNCTKNKEEKAGKGSGRGGSKRDKDAARSRKDGNKQEVGVHPGQPPMSVPVTSAAHLFNFGAKSGSSALQCCGEPPARIQDIKTTLESGILSNPVVLKKDDEVHDEESARPTKKLKTEKVLSNVGYGEMMTESGEMFSKIHLDIEHQHEERKLAMVSVGIRSTPLLVGSLQ
eukprot:g43818.t1